MKFGVHLPLMDLGGQRFAIDHLVDYVETATDLGFEAITAPTTGPLEPLPAQPDGPPLWVGSWGSEVGLRRAVRLGDGWLGSAYNIAPKRFGESWVRVQELLEDGGRDPAGFGNGVATMWFHIDDRRADEVLEERLAPVVHRPVEELCARLAFGSAPAVLDKVVAYRDAGAQWMFLWPVTDDVEQLQRFATEVMAALGEPLRPAPAAGTR